jgi:transposase-like protein
MKERKHYSKSEREQHIQLWKESKLSIAAYSKQSGISLTCLRYWAYPGRKKEKVNQLAQAPFLPIQITAESEPSLEIVLELPTGMRLTLRGAVDAGYLKALIA